jgi:CBS domain-containing protein/adenylylsulfate kinase-like enzyme
MSTTAVEATPATRHAGRGVVVWITGRPGSGKSTIARATAAALEAIAAPVRLLALDDVARVVCPEGLAGPLAAEHAHRALAYTAAALAGAGAVVVVDAPAPRRAWRELARALAPRFIEVQLRCPADVCASRERSVRWGLAPAGPAPGAAGLEVVPDYEESLWPELVVHTHVQACRSAVEEICQLVAHDAQPANSTPRKEPPMATVRDLMTPDPLTVAPDTPVFEARRCMLRARIRHLLVTEGTDLVGVVTDRDIRLNLPSQATSLSMWEVNYLLARLTVAKVMTRTVITIGPSRDARDAARLMLEHRIGCLPVLEKDRLIGIVTETDILRAFVGDAVAAGTR